MEGLWFYPTIFIENVELIDFLIAMLCDMLLMIIFHELAKYK